MNIYLISANSYYLINEEVRKIIKDNNYFTMNLNKVGLDTIIDEASYMSFDTNKKIIIVNNANFFGSTKINEDDQNKLINYFNKPNPNTILIFTTQEKIDLRKKIVKLIKEKYKLINIEPFNRKQLADYIKNELIKKGYNIDFESTSYILDNTYQSIDIIHNELEKIYMYYEKPTNIKIGDLKIIIGNSLDNNSFHFVEAVINKDLKKALKIYNDLCIYKIEEISLVILLAREYKKIYYVKKYKYLGYNFNKICSELNMRDWQLEKLYNTSIKYKEKELLDNIKYLATIDQNIKKGIFDKSISLISFMVEACQ